MTETAQAEAAGSAAKADGASTDSAPITVSDPGSDFMVDVIKTLDLEYVALNPGGSSRGLHESIIHYGGNSKPSLIAVNHEEIAVAIAMVMRAPPASRWPRCFTPCSACSTPPWRSTMRSPIACRS
jgi:hypothetical protein